MCDVFWWSTFPNQQTLGFIIGLLYPPEVHPGHPHRKGRTLLFFINCCASRPKDFSSVLDNGSFWKVRCSTYSKPKFHVQKRNRLGRVKTRQKKGGGELFFLWFYISSVFWFQKVIKIIPATKKKTSAAPIFFGHFGNIWPPHNQLLMQNAWESVPFPRTHGSNHDFHDFACAFWPLPRLPCGRPRVWTRQSGWVSFQFSNTPTWIRCVGMMLQAGWNLSPVAKSRIFLGFGSPSICWLVFCGWICQWSIEKNNEDEATKALIFFTQQHILLLIAKTFILSCKNNHEKGHIWYSVQQPSQHDDQSWDVSLPQKIFKQKKKSIPHVLISFGVLVVYRSCEHSKVFVWNLSSNPMEANHHRHSR